MHDDPPTPPEATRNAPRSLHGLTRAGTALVVAAVIGFGVAAISLYAVPDADMGTAVTGLFVAVLALVAGTCGAAFLLVAAVGGRHDRARARRGQRGR